MALFQLATEILESSLPFPELLPAEGNPSLYFKQDIDNELSEPPDCWIRSVELDDGSVWIATGKIGSNFLFRFPSYSDFLFSPATGQITCYPRRETDIGTVRHLLLDHIFPLILHFRGFTVLHASAVADPSGGAMVFVGKSGAGKSTFAASLCKEGFPLLADDCLAIDVEGDEPQAIPVYAGLRLWSNSTEQLEWNSNAFPTVAQYTDKKRVPVASTGLRYESGPARISTIFLFNPDGYEARAIKLRHLSLRDGMIRLLESSYCLDPEDKQKNEVDFHRLSKLAQAIPILQVDFPYDFSQFPQLREAVLSAPTRR